MKQIKSLPLAIFVFSMMLISKLFGNTEPTPEEVLSLKSPIRVTSINSYKDGGTKCFALLDAANKELLFCLDGRMEHVSEKNSRYLFIGALHPSDPKAEKLPIGGKEEKAVLSILDRCLKEPITEADRKRLQEAAELSENERKILLRIIETLKKRQMEKVDSSPTVSATSVAFQSAGGFNTSTLPYPGLPSPDGRFIAYTIPAYEFDDWNIGSMLFVRLNSPDAPPKCLLENNKWIDVKWSPDSRFLAVIDHDDGHMADVYVYGIAPSTNKIFKTMLYYHTPNPRTYDVKWDVTGWDMKDRSIYLSMYRRDGHINRNTITNVLIRIGSEPIAPPDNRAIHLRR